MQLTLALAGAGLALLAPARTGRRRLIALTGSRLPATAGSVARSRSRIPSRSVVIVAGAVTVGMTAVVTGPIPAGLAAICSAVAALSLRQLSRERQSVAEDGRLAELVSALVAEHAAGATLAAALSTVAVDAGPWQSALLRAGQSAATGGEPALALAGEPRLAPLAVAVGLADRSGIALAPVLTRVRSDVLAEHANRRAVAEAVAGPRSSALLLAALPVIGLAMGAALGARPLHVLTHTSAGLAALVAGVLLELAGLLWTLRLTG